MLDGILGNPTLAASLMFMCLRSHYLGYWHAVNKGILHRDISDGNVLIDDSSNGDHQRDSQPRDKVAAADSRCEPEVKRSTASDNHPLAKSRQALQVVLEQLGPEQKMRGFLGDYDLFTTHSKMGPEFFGDSFKRGWSDESNSGAEDDEDGTKAKPDAKRRKLNDNQPPSKSSGGNSTEPGRSDVASGLETRKGTKKYKGIDFRTGTPTFMSIRVLNIRIGTPYVHHFMDDLESFFWLLLWCVVEHRDDGPNKNGTTTEPTERALQILLELDRADGNLHTIASSKASILMRCYNGAIEDDLEACGSSWATDPIVIGAIRKLGTYFFDPVIKRYPFAQYPPEIAFPKIVEIFTEALNGHFTPSFLGGDEAGWELDGHYGKPRRLPNVSTVATILANGTYTYIASEFSLNLGSVNCTSKRAFRKSESVSGTLIGVDCASTSCMSSLRGPKKPGSALDCPGFGNLLVRIRRIRIARRALVSTPGALPSVIPNAPECSPTIASPGALPGFSEPRRDTTGAAPPSELRWAAAPSRMYVQWVGYTCE
ncbi:hypothetical protein RHS02_08152, partial [Rhizoctonia solani]